MDSLPADTTDEGLRNLRDVGGIPVGDGRRVATGRLYRSDAPIPGDRVPDLQPWPPRTVVDLRSPGEAATAHPLETATTRVINIPLFGSLDPSRMSRGAAVDGVDLPTIYRRLMARASERLVAVVALVAENPGPVLVHCAAGKDRTGVTTAVTLAAVGAGREAIVADYVRTEESLEHLHDRMARSWAQDHREETLRRLTEDRPDLMLAPATAIEAVLETLEGWPGGAGGWLLDHGLAPEALEALHIRLLEVEDDAA